MVRIRSGDLLRAPADALVNPVNCVGVCGKGLALEFKRAYPANFRAYAEQCRRHELVVGRIFTFGHRPTIVNFPTKRHWRQPSRRADIELGLVALVSWRRLSTAWRS